MNISPTLDSLHQHKSQTSTIDSLVTGGKFLLDMRQPIRVTLDSEAITDAIRIYHCVKQFERWKVLRKYRPVVKMRSVLFWWLTLV